MYQNSRRHFLEKLLSVNGLIHSCLDLSTASVAWTQNVSENNFGISHEFIKYLKRRYRLGSDHILGENALVTIILPKKSEVFGCCWHKWVNGNLIGHPF